VSKVRQPVSQALYERLFLCSPDFIVVVDCDGSILEVNPQVESLFGYAASELLGSRVEILIPERLRSAHLAHRSDYGRQPHIRPMGTGLDLCGQRKDGSEFPVDVMLSPVDSGEVLLVLGVIRDITERKRLEEAMRQLVSTDDLTGLGNYRRLQDEFERATKWLQPAGRSSALVVLDLDGLKKINDYGDHSGVFVRNDDNWTVDEQLAGKRQPTQFGRALEQLGVTFIAANSPQAKGRIERLWGLLQDRLTSELRLAGARDLDSANAVLRKFIADYNRRFAKKPREPETAWRPAPESLERICCFIHERVVSNDNVVQWGGRRFQIPQQARRYSFAGAKVHIYQALDGRVSLYCGDTRLEHSALPGG